MCTPIIYQDGYSMRAEGGFLAKQRRSRDKPSEAAMEDRKRLGYY